VTIWTEGGDGVGQRAQDPSEELESHGILAEEGGLRQRIRLVALKKGRSLEGVEESKRKGKRSSLLIPLGKAGGGRRRESD